uniref:bis(5'-adenosyl)-triphosphatase enpp4-like isoform X1 n=1 Tax=Styela clava TaxID=7725 RepID=UPI00193AC1C5|nr:bis(5'-adenosyl)-triphosphatase enpp4-like isoform X1 [Styela clava]
MNTMEKCKVMVAVLIYSHSMILCWSHAKSAPKLLVISFDGFRWDYLDKTDTPNFDRIANNGVRAKWVKDSFLTVTFPNHYTIATGLHVESHGIVGNVFYDPVFDEIFNMSSPRSLNDSRFWGGEPVWITNELQGGTSGVYYWPGCGANIKGIRPTHCVNIVDITNSSLNMWKHRTDTVIGWLDDLENDVNLAMLYFGEPDVSGHRYGPNAPEIVQKIQLCDAITGYILSQLDKYGIDEINIIITSDHGMSEMNRKKFITLDDHVDMKKIKHIMNDIASASIWPDSKKNITEELFKNLSAIDPVHYKVWLKKDIPPEYHYSNNRRISSIFMQANEGWGIRENWNDPRYKMGRHGYNNSLMNMHVFFLATGPSFKEGFLSEPFELIDIYSLMCYILEIKPAPNNGSFDAVRQLLRDERPMNYEDYNSKMFRVNISIWEGICIGVICNATMLIYLLKRMKKGYLKLPVMPNSNRIHVDKKITERTLWANRV